MSVDTRLIELFDDCCDKPERRALVAKEIVSLVTERDEAIRQQEATSLALISVDDELMKAQDRLVAAEAARDEAIRQQEAAIVRAAEAERTQPWRDAAEEAVRQREAAEARAATAEAMVQALEAERWHCGCGHVNAITFVLCAQCGRVPSETQWPHVPEGW